MADAAAMHSFDSSLYYSRAAYTDTPPVIASLAAIQIVVDGAIQAVQPWYEIGNIISMNGIPMERSVTQVTHLRSPDKAHEKVPGFLDGGQFTFKLNYSKAAVGETGGATGLTGITGGLSAPDTSPRFGRTWFAAVFPDHGLWLFKAFVKSLPTEVPEDNRLTVDVTLEISGKPIFYEFV